MRYARHTTLRRHPARVNLVVQDLGAALAALGEAMVPVVARKDAKNLKGA
jgi:hypothetical protein